MNSNEWKQIDLAASLVASALLSALAVIGFVAWCVGVVAWRLGY